MSQDFKSESDLRLNNIHQYIKDIYKGNYRKFNRVFKQNLALRCHLTEDEISSKSGQLRQILNGHRNFTLSIQEIVENAFNLPKGILARQRATRTSAYIFVSCLGKSANALYSKLQSHEIVDEVSILFGDVDMFIKVYGSLDEIQKFVTSDIHLVEDITITSTRTYFSLSGKIWSKYPVNNHPEYIPPSNRWFKILDGND